MSTKRVLVTGARGLIGQHCLPHLAALGYEVHAVTSQAAPAAAGDLAWHRADLLDAGAARALVAAVRPTHALHLAWVATPGIYASSLDNLRWAAAGPALLEALLASGTRRIVSAGTCAEYDWNKGPCDERSTPLSPGTLYAASKHAWHIAAEAMARAGSAEMAWARIFLLYGPGEHETRIVPAVVRALLRGETAACSAGTQTRDFLYVKDTAGALVALLDSPVCGSVNIASGHGVTVRDLVLTIAERIGRPDLVQFGAPANEPASLIAETKRLASEVGWRPQYDLASGLAETIEWWKRRA